MDVQQIEDKSNQTNSLLNMYNENYEEYQKSKNNDIENLHNRSSIHLEINKENHDLSNCLTLSSTSNRNRHDSSSSSTNSIKYTQFVPSSLMSIRRRNVIQSILLNVQRQKKFLENFGQTSNKPTIYELGLEFLRIYDGKFNYPQGHTFVMYFLKRTWFLTIENIKCIECQLGESEPRSILILKYKDKFTPVQV